MRITYRYQNNKSYWNDRWSNVQADNQMKNEDVYPLKYAKKLIKKKNGLILEAGCGNGRILRYFHNLKFNIIGIDFIQVAIEKLKQKDRSLKVKVGRYSPLEIFKSSSEILIFSLSAFNSGLFL